jgi:kinesin family member C2/C3
LVEAAENYHKVLAENQKLFNEVQELKGIYFQMFFYLKL